MRPWILIVAAACGASAPASPPVVSRPVAIAPPTCTDVGVILRSTASSSDPDAGSAREIAIAQMCTQDRWAPEVLACVTRSRTPAACLDQLPPALAASYQVQLASWTATLGEPAPTGSGDSAPLLPCDEVAAAVDHYAGDVTIEHDWVRAALEHLVARECAAGAWQEATKQCLVAPAAPPDALASCLANESTGAGVAKRIADVRDRAAKISAIRRKPASAISCAKVVAAYYADGAWHGMLDHAKPAERKRAIAGSRTAMQKACSADGWDATLRACLATGGAADCFDESTVTAAPWGFPAAAAGGDAMPPECAAYKRVIEGLQSCAELPQETRDALGEMLKSLVAQVQADPSLSEEIRIACTAGATALDQAALCRSATPSGP